MAKVEFILGVNLGPWDFLVNNHHIDNNEKEAKRNSGANMEINHQNANFLNKRLFNPFQRNKRAGKAAQALKTRLSLARR